MNSMNGFSGLQKQMQGQLDTFSNRLSNDFRKSRSTSALSQRRGGEPGEIIPEGHRSGKLNQFTPEQMELFKQLFSHISPDSYLSRLASGDESLFNEMEAPALRQFNELQGNLSSRFSGMGLGGRNSSGFQNSSTQAASNFSQDLASRRQELQRQAIMDLMGLSHNLLKQQPYEKFLTKKQYPQQQQDQSGDLLSGLLSALGGAGAGYFSGGIPGAIFGGTSGFAKGYGGY